MYEVGNPDSSRIWDGAAFKRGMIIEKSKEAFRQQLLSYFPDPDILLNKERMPERESLAIENALPLEMLMGVSETYLSIAETITGKKIQLPENPRQEIIDTLSTQYNLVS
jgi:phosphoribosylaminoimidazole-succinocarboxamide synthase